METVFHNSGLYLLFLLIIIYIIALVCSVVVSITNIIFKRSSQKLLRMNMIIKLIHIPAYILIFTAGLVFTITIFTMGITAVLIIFDCMTIFLTGLIGLSGIIRGFAENKLSKNTAIIHALLQFVFCFDIISSIIVYRKVKSK